MVAKGARKGRSGARTATRQAARIVTRMASRAGATRGEGQGIVSKVTAKGSSAKFRAGVVKQVRQEKGAAAAQKTRKALRTLESTPYKKAARKASRASKRAGY